MIRSVTFQKKVSEVHPFGTTYKYIVETINGNWDTIDDAYNAACAKGADHTKSMIYR